MSSSLTINELTPERSKDGTVTVPVLQVSGRLDTHTVSILEKAMSQAMSKNVKSLVLEMSGLTYVSSSGLRALLMARLEARDRKGTIMLCALTPQVRDVFDMVGFTSLFDIRDTLENGRSALI
jgi:anti-anti-sigma factor